jgi:hypothetical protein
MSKSIGDFWEKHKTLAQIIAILGVVAGIYGNHYETSQNSDIIQGQNNWMKDVIKEQAREIQSLEISNAVQEQQICDLKEFYLNKK